MAAVMQRDDRMMSVLWASYRLETKGLPREEIEKRFAVFGGMIEAAGEGFEQAKTTGELPPDPLGVTLFRAMRLGKGAFSVPLGVTMSDDGESAVVRTRLNSNLDNLQLDVLPTGVLVYVAGFPLGRLERISVNYEKIEDKAFLGAVDLEWRLRRAPEGAGTPTGWLIDSITADPDTAVMWEPGKRPGRD